MLSRVFMLCVLVLCCINASAQGLQQELGRDTFYYRTSFLNRTYLLDGKPVNLPVMAFFMRDIPESNNDINIAQISDQLTIAGYSIGSLFTIGGMFVTRQDKELGNGLIQLGLIGISSGVIFQIVSGHFKFEAVKHYNKAVKRNDRKKVSNLQVRLGIQQTGIVLGF